MKQKVIKLTKKPKLPTYKDIIKSKMSYKEINENSSIKNSIQKIKKIKFNYLSNHNTKVSFSKSNELPSDLLLDTKKAKIQSNLNEFTKTFYNFNKKLKINKIKGRRNTIDANFSEEYKLIKNHELFQREKMLNEIKDSYNKKNISLPLIEDKNDTKNLFKLNLILISPSNLQKAIRNNAFDERNNNKSISYFQKIENNLIKNKNKIFNPYLQDINEEIEQIMKDKSENTKIDLKRRNTIVNRDNLEKSKKEINKINDTLNNLEDIDFFFESNNENYLKYLKGDTSKNISKYSTKDKTGFALFRNNCLKKKNSPLQNINYNTSKSFHSVQEKNESFKSNINKSQSYINLINNKRKTFINFKMSDFNSTYHKVLEGNKNTKLIKKIKLNNKNISYQKNAITNLESLYNEIKNSDDLKKNNVLIKNFLAYKNYNKEIKIEPSDIYYIYQNARNNILKKTFYTTNTKLKYEEGFNIKKSRIIEKIENICESKIKNLDFQIEKLSNKFS